MPVTSLATGHPDLEAYSLSNAHGVVCQVLNYGASVMRLQVPAANGGRAELVLGCTTPADYLRPHPHIGCLVGRHSNRISHSRYRYRGETVQLTPNVGAHHLHGGPAGFSQRLWSLEPYTSADDCGVRLRLTSAAGDQGYPGTLSVQADYRLSATSELRLHITATTTEPTPVSIAPHHYFHLAQERATPVTGPLADHQLCVFADRYLPVDAELLQLGRMEPVAATPFDLRHPTALTNAVLRGAHPQLQRAGGFDHHFMLNGEGLRRAAVLRHAGNGRALTLLTDAIGVQLYCANSLAFDRGIDGARYANHGAVCLEPQACPDAPNHAAYPSSMLLPGAKYSTTSVLQLEFPDAQA